MCMPPSSSYRFDTHNSHILTPNSHYAVKNSEKLIASALQVPGILGNLNEAPLTVELELAIFGRSILH